MQRCRKIAWLGIVPLLLLCGCFKTPSIVGVKHATITGFTDSLVKTSVTVDIKNDNMFTLRVSDFKYRFGIQGDTLGGGFIRDQLVLKKHSVTTINFYPEVNFRKLATIPDSVFKQDSIPVTFYLSGKFTFLKLFKTRSFTVYVKWRDMIDSLINMSNLTGILKIRKLELKSISLEKSVVNVDFDFDNFLPVKMTLDSLSVDVLADLRSRKMVGNWKGVTMKEIAPRQVETVPVLVSIQNISMMQSAFQKLFTGDFAYYMDGNAYISIEGRKVVIPVKQRIGVGNKR